MAERMSGLEFATVRHMLGLTYAECARLLGVTARSVQRWEAGSDPIPYSMPGRLGDIREEHDRLVERLAGMDTVCLPRDKAAYRERPRGWYVAALARVLSRGVCPVMVWELPDS